MMHHLHRVMQLYGSDATEDRVKQAFLSLIRQSDAVGWATPALNESAIEQLTEMVIKSLHCDTGDEMRIPWDVGCALSANDVIIDYYDVFDFLERHSEDLFLQATSRGRTAQAIAEVDQMWVGIALRYRYCASHKQRYFPISTVIELREVVQRLSSQPDCGDAVVCRALETLGMLERDPAV
ncbi:MAG: hypothetical protein V4719_26150 [Planctomycetota bacterium]